MSSFSDAGKVKLIKRTLQQLYDKMERLDMINLPPGLCFAVFDSDILLQMVAMINILARGHQLLIVSSKISILLLAAFSSEK